MPSTGSQDTEVLPAALRLFDSFALLQGQRQIALSTREQRLLALLALEGNRPRSYLAGVLWPDSTEHRASGSLRAAVWNLERSAPGVLIANRTHLALSDEVRTDVSEFRECAIQVIDLRDGDNSGSAAHLIERPAPLFAGVLLPGWYDEWVLSARAHIQQLQLRALEAATELFAAGGRTATALTTAIAAQAMEPLRESAQRALISLHIAEGNYHEALREYDGFRLRLDRELGVSPSARLDALVRPLLSARSASRSGLRAGRARRVVGRRVPA
jgi:DNA-binding SARP family transcriptional activator